MGRGEVDFLQKVNHDEPSEEYSARTGEIILYFSRSDDLLKNIIPPSAREKKSRQVKRSAV